MSSPFLRRYCAQADLRDVGARQPVLQEGADGIAVAEALVGVAHVEVGIERDQPDFVEAAAEAEQGRSRHRIIAADQQGQRVRLAAGADRGLDDGGRLLNGQAVERYIAAIGDPCFQLPRRLDIVEPDPFQSPAQNARRPVASP